MKSLKRYSADESGATAIEYGLIASLISVLMITGASALSGSLNDKFDEIAAVLDGPDEPAFAAVQFSSP